VHLHAVENPLLEVVKHADLHCIKDVRLHEGSHNTWNISKHVESLVNMAQQEFGIGCVGAGSVQLSI